MNRGLSREELMQLLEKRLDGRLWSELATEIGISQSLLSRIRKGTATPSPKLLAFLGLREERIYVKAQE
jgi:transcriptional regulator with XRE-family HTH domain